MYAYTQLRELSADAAFDTVFPFAYSAFAVTNFNQIFVVYVRGWVCKYHMLKVSSRQAMRFRG